MTTMNMAERHLEYDTTMCGASKVWLPMKVAYSREVKAKVESDQLMFKNFTSETYKLLNADMIFPHYELVLAINNLFFTLFKSGIIRDFYLIRINYATAIYPI